tara:strand:+ start:105 stop:245 length:141 start_codon:yes stop_codon:yes gene_type:complete
MDRERRRREERGWSRLSQETLAHHARSRSYHHNKEKELLSSLPAYR